MTRFIDNADGTITDNKTGLMWEKTGCADNTFTFEEAHEYAKDLRTGDYKDWRLPTIQELFSIVDHSKSEPAIDPIFNCQSSLYWSGTVYEGDDNNAWHVDFYDGLVDGYFKSNNNYVRCVRSGPEKINKKTEKAKEIKKKGE